jgi:hypothetical protein
MALGDPLAWHLQLLSPASLRFARGWNHGVELGIDHDHLGSPKSRRLKI